MTRLGPLVVTGDGVGLDAAAGSGCRFLSSGVELWDPDVARQVVPWLTVLGVAVHAPARFRWLRAAPGLLIPMAIESEFGGVEQGWLSVHVTVDRWGNGPSADFGRVGPYRRGDLKVLDALLAAGPLPDLADPARVRERLTVGRPGSRPGRRAGRRARR